jgi:hypothetical protein
MATLGLRPLSRFPLTPTTLADYRAEVEARFRRIRSIAPDYAEGASVSFVCMRCSGDALWRPGQFDDGMCVDCQWACFHSPRATERLQRLGGEG